MVLGYRVERTRTVSFTLPPSFPGKNDSSLTYLMMEQFDVSVSFMHV
jgi:hypothetical protein